MQTVTPNSIMNHHDWNHLPDACLESILLCLSPRSVGILRLVNKTWKQQVSLALHKISLRIWNTNTDLKTVQSHLAKVFPNLTRLELCFKTTHPFPPAFATSPDPILDKWILKSNLSSLNALKVRSMDRTYPTISLESPSYGSISTVFAKAAGDCSFLSSLHISHTTIHGKLTHESIRNLKCLKLLGVRITHFRDFLTSLASELGNTLQELSIRQDSWMAFSHGDSSEMTEVWINALKRMRNLKKVALSELVAPINDALCCALSQLPRLVSIELSTFSAKNTCLTEDGSLSVLESRSGTLECLALKGWNVSNAAVHYIASLTNLTSLEFDTGNDPIFEQMHYTLENADLKRHHGLAKLASLHRLQVLKLGGWPTVSISMIRALGRLPSLQRVEFHACMKLDDSILFELAHPTKAQIYHVAFQNCPRVTDIGLAALAKSPVLSSSLTALELKGANNSNVTDQGIASLYTIKNIALLDISGYDAVTDVGMSSYLGQGGVKYSLKHLGLSDTSISDEICSMLPSMCPSLTVLDIEHCRKVTDRGAQCLADSLQTLTEVRVFESSITQLGIKDLENKTGAVVSSTKPCWWGFQREP